jgi:hypothetical protein
MKNLAFSALLFLSLTRVTGQNLIGYSDDEIKKFMRENRKEMNIENVTNSDHNYLKFSDSSETQTILFFLDNKAVCSSIRVICDEGIRKQKMNELNSIYKKKSDNTWTDVRQGKKYLISLKNDEWSFVITIETEK